jgi:hypothetical protein
MASAKESSDGHRFVWDERLAPLLKHPDKWVVVARKPNYNAAHVAVIGLKNARVPTSQVDLSEFDFAARTNRKDGTGEVIACFVSR